MLCCMQGGKDFSSMADFLARFGVSSMEQSAEKILEVITTQVGVPAGGTGRLHTAMLHSGIRFAVCSQPEASPTFATNTCPSSKIVPTICIARSVSRPSIVCLRLLQVPAGNALIIMAHNGPTGMGGERHSICGCDWLAEAGDHGDPDLQQVLTQLQKAGRQVALLLNGHMHHMIKGGWHRCNSLAYCGRSQSLARTWCDGE